MNKLKKYLFSDLYEMSSGMSSTKDQAGHGFPFVSFSTIFNNYFLPDTLPDLMDSSEAEQVACSVQEHDIFLTRTSEKIDELAMSCVALKDYPTATFSGFCKRLRPTTSGIVDSKYMAFYLRNSFFRKTINNNATMTLRASFNEAIFSFLELHLPEYEQQCKISEFLYTIEKKIQLNNKINQELEEMAKTLYDYWFVQFDFPDEQGKPYRSSGGKMVFCEELNREVPEGWGVTALSEIESNIITGKTPSTKNPDFYDGKIPFITIGDIRGNMYVTKTVQTLTESGAESQKNKYVPEDSICVTCIATTGLVGFATENSQTNQQINTVICQKDENKPYLYFAIKNHFDSTSGVKSGATFKNMNKEEFSSIEIFQPPDHLKENFYTIVRPSFQKIKQLSHETKELTTLRDWLLPMLMNGQAVVG